MTRLQEQFLFSRHAQDRLRERFPQTMHEIEFEQSAALRIRKMHELLWNSTIENRIINDTMFMQYLHEKYGYDKTMKFFANNNILFIGIMASDANVIVTVVNRDDYASRYLRPVAKKLQPKPNTYRLPRRKTLHRKAREHLETDIFED